MQSYLKRHFTHFSVKLISTSMTDNLMGRKFNSHFQKFYEPM